MRNLGTFLDGSPTFRPISNQFHFLYINSVPSNIRNFGQDGGEEKWKQRGVVLKIYQQQPRFSLRLRSPAVLRELIIFDLRPLIDDFFPSRIHKNYKGCKIHLKCCITRPPFSFESSQKTEPTSPLPPLTPLWCVFEVWK